MFLFFAHYSVILKATFKHAMYATLLLALRKIL